MFVINEILFVLFVLVIIGILVKDRRKLNREGIVFLRRTKKGVNFIDRTSNKFPRFWKSLFTIGAIVATGALLFASFFIIMTASQVVTGTSGGVKLVLPGPVDNAVSAPAVLFMPWYFWIIGIIILTVPHEFAHGIASRLHKIKIKTVGWFFLIIAPGAFVEPDDKQLKKASTSAKIKIYGAGSFANFLTALLFLGIMLLYVPATLNSVGLISAYYEPGFPMAEANVTGPILTINGLAILDVETLSNTMTSIDPGTVVRVETTTGNYSITTVAHDARDGSRIGVLGPYIEYREIKSELAGPITTPLIFFFGQLFDWIILLSIGVGLVNLLPVKPLDGGFIMEAIFEKIGGHRTKIIVKVVSVAFLLLLLYSVFGGLI